MPCPMTCSATWMSLSAQVRSSSRAASSAGRISGADSVAPSLAPSVSTAERNSISSASLTTPARLTSCSAGAPGAAVGGGEQGPAGEALLDGAPAFEHHRRGGRPGEA